MDGFNSEDCGATTEDVVFITPSILRAGDNEILRYLGASFQNVNLLALIPTRNCVSHIVRRHPPFVVPLAKDIFVFNYDTRLNIHNSLQCYVRNIFTKDLTMSLPSRRF